MSEHTHVIERGESTSAAGLLFRELVNLIQLRHCRIGHDSYRMTDEYHMISIVQAPKIISNKLNSKAKAGMSNRVPSLPEPPPLLVLVVLVALVHVTLGAIEKLLAKVRSAHWFEVSYFSHEKYKMNLLDRDSRPRHRTKSEW